MPKHQARYKIIESPVPPLFLKSASPYQEILDNFLRKDIKSARIEVYGKSPKQISGGLAGRVKKAKAPVKVITRRQRIYLQRTDK